MTVFVMLALAALAAGAVAALQTSRHRRDQRVDEEWERTEAPFWSALRSDGADAGKRSRTRSNRRSNRTVFGAVTWYPSTPSRLTRGRRPAVSLSAAPAGARGSIGLLPDSMSAGLRCAPRLRTSWITQSSTRRRPSECR